MLLKTFTVILFINLTDLVFQRCFKKYCSKLNTAANSEPHLMYCNYSVLKDLSQKFEFLKREEPLLYQLIISLPLIENKEELDDKLKEVARINFNQLENLKDYLKRLATDK